MTIRDLRAARLGGDHTVHDTPFLSATASTPCHPAPTRGCGRVKSLVPWTIKETKNGERNHARRTF